jgi:hypothetical protein
VLAELHTKCQHHIKSEVRLFVAMLKCLRTGCLFCLCPVMWTGNDDGGSPRVADDTTGPLSHAGNDRQEAQGITEAGQGFAKDQGDTAARDPTEGHPDSAKGHNDVM